ncbi:MAG: hypothetical protein AAGA71_06465 [Pseudomonadota bacterium]
MGARMFIAVGSQTLVDSRQVSREGYDFGESHRCRHPDVGMSWAGDRPPLFCFADKGSDQLTLRNAERVRDVLTSMLRTKGVAFARLFC